MHWSVGMLLHAVCVFFYKGEKKETSWRIDRVGVFPTHFLVSMVLLIWVTFHTCPRLILCWKMCPVCFDAKQMLWYSPFSRSFVLLCHHLAFVTQNCFFPLLAPEILVYIWQNVCVFRWPYSRYRIISRSGFYCLLFLEQPIELNYLF